MSTSTETISVEDLAVMFAEELACSACGRAEAVVVFTPTHPPCRSPKPYKCVECYAKLRAGIEVTIATFGYVKCSQCKVRFPTFDSFTRYVPL